MGLSGLMNINNKDAYTEYGVFLAETEELGHVNSDELMKVPPIKSYTKVSFKEHNGEDLPGILPAAPFEGIDRSLQFGLSAETVSLLNMKLDTFITAIKNGWLSIVIEGYRTYKMYYQDVTSILCYDDGNTAALILKVKFREPKYKE